MSDSQELFAADPPSKKFWLLFKIASHERLLQMQQGLLYMNSLDYFSNLKDEESLPLRTDELENVCGVLRAGKHDQGFSTLSVRIGGGEEINLGPEAVITARFPMPKNYMLFCMSALADGPDGKIPGEVDDQIYLDARLLNFGSHLLLIRNPAEFSNRVSAAIAKEKKLFWTKYFHECFGMVNYRSLENYSGAKGLYTKDSKYSWQREMRVAFGVHDSLLNTKGAYEFNVGDLSDISQIIPVQSFIDEPITITRRTFESVDGVVRRIG